MMDWVLAGLVILFLGTSASALVHSRWARRLPVHRGRHSESERGRIACSVVLAARNEEARIEQTLRRLGDQSERAIEIIAVDDRSTDQTGAILNRFAAEDPRMRVVRVEALPSGWLGKCHACHVGAEQARGDWILFTDADCWLKADVIARALEVAAGAGVEHLALTPGVSPGTLPARAWHLAFLVSLADWFSRNNRDRAGAYFGMGAFNLVRADLYRRWGGYEALRMTVLDDVRFGLLVRRAGGKTRAYIGGDDVECHWGNTARGMIRIMEKNYFAAAHFRTGIVLLAAVVGGLAALLTVIGPFTGTWVGRALPLAWMTMAAPAGVFARRLGWGPGAALLTPFIYPVLLYALLRSAVVTLRQGGVRWRDNFYPLSELRAGGVK